MLDVCLLRPGFLASGLKNHVRVPWGPRPLQVVHGLLRVGIPDDDLTVRSLVSTQMLHATHARPQAPSRPKQRTCSWRTNTRSERLRPDAMSRPRLAKSNTTLDARQKPATRFASS